MATQFIGRWEEKALLKERLKRGDAEFIAIYGRRRVGKTSLIRHMIEQMKLTALEVTGLKNGNLTDQLAVFQKAILHDFDLPYAPPQATSWMEAFETLTKIINQLSGKKPLVFFFDELPWLATPRSGLLEALDHFWNTQWEKDSRIKLIICGSAASWILNNVVNAKGGLHNRLTLTIRLNPFNIRETGEFLAARSIRIQPQHILNLYLIMGGVPFYLRALEKGKSIAQNIDRLCFSLDGMLYQEFDRLFSSLFYHADVYIEIVQVIASQLEGVGLETLKSKLKLSKVGGTLKKRLDALEEAGFIASYIPYGREKKGIYYRIIDEYTLFYIRWIKPAKEQVKFAQIPSNYWQLECGTSRWNSWVGCVFETFCLKHIHSIIKAMEIGASYRLGTWRYVPKGKGERGVQIDLLIDREDGIVDIFEIKYAQKKYRITKQYADELGNKIDTFQEKLNLKKDIHLSMITTNGLFPNEYAENLVAHQIVLEDFL